MISYLALNVSPVCFPQLLLREARRNDGNASAQTCNPSLSAFRMSRSWRQDVSADWGSSIDGTQDGLNSASGFLKAVALSLEPSRGAFW